MNSLSRFSSATVLALLIHAASLMGQGNLTPTGAPTPTMKTLVEVEPRTHISSLPYTITASGSYYLTTNLNGGGTAAGIMVQASGVTIDLRGFSILNCTTGISAAPGLKEVAVHNGMIRGCTGSGIDLGTVAKCRLEDVIVCNNGGDGASVGAAALVTLCTAVANGARGLALDHGGKIVHCVVQSNSGSGIVVTSNCQVNDNTCERNGSGATDAGVLTTGKGNRVEGNSCNDSAAYGFKINGTGNLVLRNNACGNALGDYTVGAGNNYGQVLVAPGPAFANSNPWANFSCGTPPNGPCTTDVQCDDSDACTTDVCNIGTGECSHTAIPGCGPVCGNSVVEAGEQCDGANLNGQSCVGFGYSSGSLACNANCTYNLSGCVAIACGNGIVEAGETCDDGNTVNGDGCSAICSVQPGFQCSGSPSVCTTLCGDGQVAGTEQCDDANATPGDGCSATCSVEAGYQCVGSPSACTPVTYSLTVAKSGAGAGTVTSSPAGISCGADCSENYSSSTVVTLSASPAVGSTFAGWSGACSGVGSCNVTMDAAKSVTATFSLNIYTLTTAKSGTGSGTVASSPSGINCGADCSEVYNHGTSVTLTASPSVGSTFTGWSGGGCSGTGTCNTTMTAATTVTATFTLNAYTLTVSKSGAGTGTVTSSPAGISCGADCSEPYNHGTVVTLTAVPSGGSTFAGWSGGGCTGTGTCNVSVTSAAIVTATFTAP